VSKPRWRADGREVFYLSEDRKLMAVPVEQGRMFGRPKELFQTRIVAERVTAYRTHYSPNRDGTRFLVNTQSGEAPPTSITVVLNWTAGLEQSTRAPGTGVRRVAGPLFGDRTIPRDVGGERGIADSLGRVECGNGARRISAVVLRNRGAGPFGLLNLLDERCGGVFDDIDAVIPPAERDEFMSRYRIAAGLAKEELNGSPSIIPPGARVRHG
jgi:hypothetical protein